MSMKVVPCKFCGKDMQVSAESKSGVCSDCVLQGRLNAPQVETPAPTSVEVSVAAVDTPAPTLPSDATHVDFQAAQAEAAPAADTTATAPVEVKPRKKREGTGKKREGYSTRVTELLKTGVDTKQIVETLLKEFPKADAKNLRNLVYVVRNRLGAKK